MFLLRHSFGCSVGLGHADTSSFSPESLKGTPVDLGSAGTVFHVQFGGHSAVC